MAVGARISIVTGKHTYVLQDTVDAATTIDTTRGTGMGTARFQIWVDGAQVRPGSIKTQGMGATGGFVSFVKALRAFYEMVRYYERH